MKIEAATKTWCSQINKFFKKILNIYNALIQLFRGMSLKEKTHSLEKKDPNKYDNFSPTNYNPNKYDKW